MHFYKITSLAGHEADASGGSIPGLYFIREVCKDKIFELLLLLETDMIQDTRNDVAT